LLKITFIEYLFLMWIDVIFQNYVQNGDKFALIHLS
jgi:hypothetical protein